MAMTCEEYVLEELEDLKKENIEFTQKLFHAGTENAQLVGRIETVREILTKNLSVTPHGSSFDSIYSVGRSSKDFSALCKALDIAIPEEEKPDD